MFVNYILEFFRKNVMTLFSNSIWCSDYFEIKCFNGEKVYVSFIIDSFDHEVISFISSWHEKSDGVSFSN
jgi:hypothetical protein